MLRFKHPDKFNHQGNGKWGGVLYGASLQGLVLDEAIIYRGTFGCGFFQCIYRPGPAYWAMIPGTLEWQVVAALLFPFGFFWWPIWSLAAGMFGLSGLVATVQASQAKLPPAHDGLRSRALVAALCYLQPIVRSMARYKTRYLGYADEGRPSLGALKKPLCFRTLQQAQFWAPNGRSDRMDLLQELIEFLRARRCGVTIDTGWSDSDLEVFRGPWTSVQVRTAQEEHGNGDRLVRVSYQHRASALTKAAAVFGVVTTVFLACFSWPAAAVWLAGIMVMFAIGWYRWAWLATRIDEIVQELVGRLGWLSQSDWEAPRGQPEKVGV